MKHLLLSALVGILTTTPEPSYVDMSWVSDIISAIESFFHAMATPPISYFVGVSLAGTVIGMIFSFIGKRRKG